MTVKLQRGKKMSFGGCMRTAKNGEMESKERLLNFWRVSNIQHW